tara:strand:+ start:93 stop:380 length:288 start_codon:yes stop_codon:yes gene_type:complete
MDTIRKFERFNTDVYNRGQGCGGETMISKERGFDYVLSEAIRLKAHIIVEPTGKYYYIKAYKGEISFENIQQDVTNNVSRGHRRKTKLTLITYVD